MGALQELRGLSGLEEPLGAIVSISLHFRRERGQALYLGALAHLQGHCSVFPDTSLGP